MSRAAPPTLSARDTRRLRLRALRLIGAPTTTVAEVVTWFECMQAQDYTSGLWSLGARLPDATRADVVGALERGEAVRTWPMRGTLHLVPPDDAGWMVRLMAGRALARARRRHEQLGLDPDTLRRGAQVLGSALAGRTRLSRPQCLEVLAGAGLDPSGQRGYHLLVYAAEVGVVCVLPNEDSQPTFGLLDDWSPAPRRPDRDEALAIIARRFVRSHGPTTVADLAGWTGLTLTDVRTGVAAAGPDIVEVLAADVPMLAERSLLDSGYSADETGPLGWHVLPGYDEFILGYKDRSLALTPARMRAVVPGGNGVFRATVVCDGRVVGLWKRSQRQGRTRVLVTPLDDAVRDQPEDLAAAFARYAAYLQEPLDVELAGDC